LGDVDGAADLEVDDGVLRAEGEVATGLEVDEAGEFAGVLDRGQEEAAEDDLGAGDAHDEGRGLDAEFGESAGDGWTDDGRVGAVGVRGKFEGGGSELGDDGSAGALGGLADAEGVAVEVDGSDDRGGALALVPDKREAAPRRILDRDLHPLRATA
jgi:hypothetical protein